MVMNRPAGSVSDWRVEVVDKRDQRRSFLLKYPSWFLQSDKFNLNLFQIDRVTTLFAR